MISFRDIFRHRLTLFDKLLKTRAQLADIVKTANANYSNNQETNLTEYML